MPAAGSESFLSGWIDAPSNAAYDARRPSLCNPTLGGFHVSAHPSGSFEQHREAAPSEGHSDSTDESRVLRDCDRGYRSSAGLTQSRARADAGASRSRRRSRLTRGSALSLSPAGSISRPAVPFSCSLTFACLEGREVITRGPRRHRHLHRTRPSALTEVARFGMVASRSSG